MQQTMQIVMFSPRWLTLVLVGKVAIFLATCNFRTASSLEDIRNFLISIVALSILFCVTVFTRTKKMRWGETKRSWGWMCCMGVSASSTQLIVPLVGQNKLTAPQLDWNLSLHSVRIHFPCAGNADSDAIMQYQATEASQPNEPWHSHTLQLIVISPPPCTTYSPLWFPYRVELVSRSSASPVRGACPSM